MVHTQSTELNPLIESLTEDRVRELWSRTYHRDGKPDGSHILPYYHENIVFQDSIQRLEGIEALTALCRRLTRRCKQLRMALSTVCNRSGGGCTAVSRASGTRGWAQGSGAGRRPSGRWA